MHRGMKVGKYYNTKKLRKNQNIDKSRMKDKKRKTRARRLSINFT